MNLMQQQRDLSLMSNATDELVRTAVPQWQINLTAPELFDRIETLRDNVHDLPQLLDAIERAKQAADDIRQSVVVYIYNI